MGSMKRLAEQHYKNGIRIKNAAVSVSRQQWRKGMDPDNVTRSFYAEVWPQLIATTRMGQTNLANEADAYLDALWPEYDPLGRIDPEAFSGTAADGRPLESLLETPLIITRKALSRGLTDDQALALGETSAALITGAETMDAGRIADGVALAARPGLTGYVRILSLPSCDRCVVLAGRVYEWNDGFLRHPQCDCRHVPIGSSEDIPGDLTQDPREAVEAGKVNGLSKSDRQAILDGADVGQVINAKRGMYTTADGRKMTTEGTTRRGWAGALMGAQRGKRKKVLRTRPEEIYKIARDRDEAISLLRSQGYFVE